MKVGDLVLWRGKVHLVTKQRKHLYNLQECDTDFPPSIIDRGLVSFYLRRGKLKIISKKTE